MAKFTDALRGYAHPILERDTFVCRYCGFDGKVWPNWLYFSQDHLLPKGHKNRDNPDFIVAACRFCNGACNRTKFPVEGKTPQQLVEMRRQKILAKRDEYRQFWNESVGQQ